MSRFYRRAKVFVYLVRCQVQVRQAWQLCKTYK